MATLEAGIDPSDRLRRLETRLGALSCALRNFAESSTEYGTLLDVIARTFAECVKDGCVVHLLSEDGWLSPVAFHMPVEKHVQDPDVVARLRAHIGAPHNISEQGSARRVIETGEALLIPRLDLAELRSTTTPEILEAYKSIGVHSLLLVALRVRGKSIGFLSLVRFDPDSPEFGEEDRDLAQALADHAGLAITSASLLQNALRELAERERAEAALRETEEQRRHAQKMEAIGRLAGSVAHDFNNLLSVILGHGTLLLEALKEPDPIREEVFAMVRAGERATTLTRQLLAISRKQVLAPRILNLNTVIRQSEGMLRRLLSEGIELVTRYDRNLVKVRVDANQIDQVVMNLVINARDAMPDGGKVTIETQSVVLDEAYASTHPEVVSGPHAMLAVSDTGMGIDEDTQPRIFEPFFTTKPKGEGTGLGLSTIFGIVKQSGGNIFVFSEPGEGTTFRIYFPKAGDVEDPLPSIAPSKVVTGNETVLVAEDHDDVRRIACEILCRYGYQVLEARNGADAVLVCERHPSPIHLLVTDVVMPKMTGKELAERLVATRPLLRVLYMSGYTDNAIMSNGLLEPGFAYLEKPLVPEAFARRVREVLDAPTGQPRATLKHAQT
jgi:signal transduction histidine kinase